MTSDISALMDGELDPDQAARTLAALRQDPRLRDTWAAYHLIGDSLRGSGPLALDISAAVSRRLAGEPTILAPARKPEARPRRFYLAAVAASVAAVGLVGLLATQVMRVGSPPVTASAPLAAGRLDQAAPVTRLAAATPPTPSRPAKAEPARVRFPAAADAYLLAHQEFSPSYAMAGLPAYVRAVSEQDAGQ